MRPNRKVMAGGLAGILSALVLLLTGVELPDEVAAALATLVAFVVSYLVPEREQ